MCTITLVLVVYKKLDRKGKKCKVTYYCTSRQNRAPRDLF